MTISSDRLFGQDYVDWHITAFTVEPKYVPRQNIDLETGELLEPPVLFSRNFSVAPSRKPVTDAIKAITAGFSGTIKDYLEPEDVN